MSVCHSRLNRVFISADKMLLDSPPSPLSIASPPGTGTPHQVSVHGRWAMGDGRWAMGTSETGGPSRLGQSSLDVSLSEPRPPDSQYTAPLAAVLQPPAFRTRQGGFKAGLPLYRLSLTGPTTHDVNRQRVHSIVDMHTAMPTVMNVQVPATRI